MKDASHVANEQWIRRIALCPQRWSTRLSGPQGVNALERHASSAPHNDTQMFLTLPSLSVALLASSLATPTIEPAALMVQSSAPDDRHFSYNYFEGGLSVGDATGIELGASVELDGPWIGVARLLYLTDEEGSVDVDYTSVSGGVGYVHALQERIDLLATAELEYGKVDRGSFGDDSDVGLRVLGGARFAATDELEVFGGISYRTIFDGEFGFNIGSRYEFNERWSALVRVDVEDDFTQFLFGARYAF